MKTIAISCIFLLLLGLVLASDEAEGLPATTEITLYISGQFRSTLCTSPDLSLAPYWSFNHSDAILNDDEVNTYFGAVVSRIVDDKGYHASMLTIPEVNLTLHNATIISCLVNRTVIQQYHITVVEAELVYLPTEEFHSALCVSPSATSSAPYFKYNDNILNNNTINKLYQASVIRNYSIDGHHQAVVVIAARGGSTLDDSRVTCLVNFTVIWSVHLITNGSSGNLSLTTTAVETIAINGGHHEGVTQTTSMPELLSQSSGLGEVAAPVISVLLVLGALVITVLVTIISVFIYKRWKCGKDKESVDSSNNDKPPNDTDQQLQSIPTSPTAVPQVSDSESEEKVVDIQPMVTGVSMNGRTWRHDPLPSTLRHSDGNTTLSCSVIIDPDEDLPALDTTTSTYIHPLNSSYSFEVGENKRELLAAATVPTSREEQSRGEGQSLAVGINCQNVLKGWTGCSHQCQYITGDSVSNEYNSGRMAEDCTPV